MTSLTPLEWNALNCFAARGDMEVSLRSACSPSPVLSSHAVRCLLECQVSSRANIREMTLVRKRIPPDSKGLYGDTSLHLSAMNGHVEVSVCIFAAEMTKRVHLFASQRNRQEERAADDGGLSISLPPSLAPSLAPFLPCPRVPPPPSLR
eukprot:796829-Rhodomonas_salina.1